MVTYNVSIGLVTLEVEVEAESAEDAIEDGREFLRACLEDDLEAEGNLTAEVVS